MSAHWIVFSTLAFLVVFLAVLNEATVPGSDSSIPVDVAGSDLNNPVSSGTVSSDNFTLSTQASSQEDQATTQRSKTSRQPGPVGTNSDDQTLDQIRNNMVGGVDAVRDSVMGFIAYLVGGAKRAVAKEVQGVVDVVQRVENKTIFIKDNLQAAGGAIVSAWANSLRQTGNITSQLFSDAPQKQPQK